MQQAAAGAGERAASRTATRSATAAGVWEAVESESAALEGEGRVLVRPSGTEPVVRVMVEAPDAGAMRGGLRARRGGRRARARARD